MFIAVVNSVLIYDGFRENRRDKMSILIAYETLIRQLLHVEKSSAVSRPFSDNYSHRLEKLPKKPGQKSYKKQCVGCYNRQRLYEKTAKAAAAAAAKVTTWCRNATKHCVFYVLMTFTVLHKI